MLASGVITFLLYYVGYEGFHYLMHRPSVPFVERSRWFRFLERHHRIHHVHMDRNLNVLFPLADAVLGTLVTASTTSAPTPEAARNLARRHSRFGRKLRADGSVEEETAEPRAGTPESPGA
jgi:sterol desaturase/sphingolipid hydroxylase (fatty acid hydroxylase superfamily)